MKIFDIPEARHYCRAFVATGGPSEGSLKKYLQGSLKGVSSLQEGTTAFDEYRGCALRNVDRCLFLAASNYRRAFDLMLPSASSWAHVTLYYGCFYAASALLGMFGTWIFNDRVVVEVNIGSPGNQQLLIDRAAKSRSTHNGSHRRFWDLFYTACNPLVHWVDPAYRFAIEPIGGSVIWQIETRNLVNYDTFAAYELMRDFQSGFKPRTFPSSLPGSLSTQFRVLEALMFIAFGFVRDFKLRTDALQNLTPIGNRKTKMRSLILNCALPALHKKSKRRLVSV